jgi:hypothetical protein
LLLLLEDAIAISDGAAKLKHDAILGIHGLGNRVDSQRPSKTIEDNRPAAADR